jgi:fusarinine C synthase
MGSIHVDDAHDQNRIRADDLKVPALRTEHGNGLRSFEVFGLASRQTAALTGMRDEVVLLSWLLTLLRTREDSRAFYEWAYKDQNDIFEAELAMSRLSTEDVMNDGLQSTVRQATTAIALHITPGTPNTGKSMSSLASLLLSSSTLSQASEVAKNEVCEPVIQLTCQISKRLTQIFQAGALSGDTLW